MGYCMPYECSLQRLCSYILLTSNQSLVLITMIEDHPGRRFILSRIPFNYIAQFKAKTCNWQRNWGSCDKWSSQKRIMFKYTAHSEAKACTSSIIEDYMTNKLFSVRFCSLALITHARKVSYWYYDGRLHTEWIVITKSLFNDISHFRGKFSR